eukprot:1604-Heterococcus_DN1.PRE.1
MQSTALDCAMTSTVTVIRNTLNCSQSSNHHPLIPKQSIGVPPCKTKRNKKAHATANYRYICCYYCFQLNGAPSGSFFLCSAGSSRENWLCEVGLVTAGSDSRECASAAAAAAAAASAAVGM